MHAPRSQFQKKRGANAPLIITFNHYISSSILLFFESKLSTDSLPVNSVDKSSLGHFDELQIFESLELELELELELR
ncbi:hypothetical protein [Desulfotruncus arcticus]|uniref:hypothetical protein n=1 Tax=Desulfotruncus arcticus TaxID=341036 RepID=UPI000B81253F|nr:hypothetical protein [Desulfotruncus arcticus]